MNLITIIILALVGLIFIPKIGFIKRAGLSANTIRILFFMKVACSIALCLTFQRLYPGESDYNTNNNYGIEEYRLLLNDPVLFVTSITKNDYSSYGAFFSAESSYWDDLSVNIIAKILAFTNILAKGNILVNSVLFGIFGFVGSVAFYKCFEPFLPQKKTLLFITCFLLPSTVYFSSGIHKDSIVFFLVGLFFYGSSKFFLQGLVAKYITLTIIAWFGLLLMRNYVAMALLPVAVCGVLVLQYKWAVWAALVSVYGSIVTIIFVIQSFTSFKPLHIISDRQTSFLAIKGGNTQLPVQLLKPTVASFIAATPRAFVNGFLTPYPLQFSSKIWWIFALENMLYILLLVIFFYYLFLRKKSVPAIFILSMAFACSMFLFIGFVVPNAGAVIRYKSIFLPTLLVASAYLIQKVNIKKRNI